MIITFIIVLFVFYSSSFFIREVKFKDSSMYDYRVLSYVYTKLDKKWFLYTLKEDINTISLNLRASFPTYSYIGINKQGSTLVIESEKIELENKIKNNISFGNITSNYNAVIKLIRCHSGVVNVILNQSVKVNDILVEPLINSSYTDAVILGEFSKYEKIVVKKEVVTFDFSSKMKVKYIALVGKNYLMKFEDYYEFQEIKVTNVLNFFNLIRLVKLYYYEKDYLNVSYDYDSAYNFAVSMIYYNLELYRKLKEEKINDVIFIKCDEFNDEYVFYFLVNYIKSIGVYLIK